MIMERLYKSIQERYLFERNKFYSLDIIFICFFFTFSLIAANDNDTSDRSWTKPKISSSSITGVNFLNAQTRFKDIDKELNKKLLYNPILEVNTNRGSLKSGFSIELPPTLNELKSITFSYNSQNTFNRGYGIGWKNELPRISKNVRTGINTPFKITGMLGESELTFVDDNLNYQLKLLDEIMQEGFNKKSRFQYQAFRPLLDNNFHLFVKASQGNNIVAWIALTLSGERWVFDKWGYPILKTNVFKNSLIFKWMDGVLVLIKDFRSQTEINIK